MSRQLQSGAMRWCLFLVVLATILVQSQVLGVPVGQTASGVVPQCRRAQAPKNHSQGTNRVTPDSWDPLYSLDLTKSGHHHEYKVNIKLGSRLLRFTDAFLSAETNGSCGVGDLVCDSNDFFRVEQEHADCPLLLTTNRKSVMERLPPLRWKAPKCGCVHFRAMVLVASTTYFAERAGVTSGPLVATVCVGGSGHRPQRLSAEERMELLCRATERFSGLEVHQRPTLLQRRRLEPRYLDIQATELALSARRNDITICCARNGNEGKRACFGDIRRRRVDRFCEDGSPDIPFTASRSRFMRQKERACCWRLGESRYTCFAVNAGTKHGAWSADYSLDETDPLNDLGDYPEEIQDLEKEYGMSLFGLDIQDPTKNTIQTTTTTPPTTTTTTPPTTTTTTPPTTTTTTPKPTTTTTTRTTVNPLNSFPARPAFASKSTNHGRRRGGKTGHNSRALSREATMTAVAVEEAFGSREYDEQQGGRSIDKTFSKLQRRMWKLSLRTQCCEAGVSAARTTYGDFGAVWAQCTHSSEKHVQSQGLRRGHKICSTQFHRCCIEVAVSTPSEVVTWKPDSASSAEWDRDRHQVNKLYLPPHARPRPVAMVTPARRQPDVTQRRRASSAEKLLSVRQAALVEELAGFRQPAYTRSSSKFVDEPEIDEEPQLKRRHSSRRSRKQNSRERARATANLVNQEREKLRREDTDEFDEEETATKRHTRRQRKQNSRERLGKTSSRSERRSEDLDDVGQERLRAARRDLSDPEVEEEPRQKRRRRPKNGGRSQEKKARQEPAPTNPTRPSEVSVSSTQQTKTAEPATESAAEKRKHLLEVEEEQLKYLFAEIAEDIDEDEEEIQEEKGDDRNELTDDETDDRSEDKSDDLEEGSENSDDEDESEDDISEVNYEYDDDVTDDEDTDETEDASVSLPNNVNSKNTEEETPKDKALATTQRRPTTKKTESAKRKRTEVSQETKSTPTERSRAASSKRTARLLRTRESLGSEDGHSGGHSGGRSARRKRKNFNARRKQRKLRHSRHMRGGHRRRDLDETVEED